ncbi:MAG TPA: EAL domain-containing protein [Pyrinomonadaceae bacterium]
MIALHRYRAARPLAGLIIAAGAAALVVSLAGLPSGQLDTRFLLLSFLALSVGNTVFVKVPRVRAYVAASDLLVFVAALAYDARLAVPLAALCALAVSLRFSRTAGGHLSGAMLGAAATYAASWAIGSLPAQTAGLQPTAELMLLSVFLLAFTRAAADSVPTALGEAQETGTGAPRAYLKTLTWSFVAYFAAASAAGLLVTLAAWTGLDAVLVALATGGVLHFTLRNRATAAARGAKVAGAAAEASHVALPSAGREVLLNAFEHAQIGMAVVSARGEWVRVNRALCELLGRSEQELLSTDLQGVTHPDDLGPALAALKKLLKGKDTGMDTEVRHLCGADGRHVWAHWSVGRFVAASNEEPHFIFQIQDIGERKVSEERLLHDAFHDPLTGLPNRALFIDHVKMAISRARRRDDRPFAVLFIDLDRFKVINDSLGHLSGDDMLVGVARRLEGCLREGDTVARVGGDEFTVLLDELQNAEEAIQIAERIQRDVSAAFQINGHEVFTTLSIGIAHGAPEYADPEDILRDADTAMYRAKTLGKARHEVFDKAMHAFAVNLLQIETDLRKALDLKQFFIMYQPIVALDDFRLCGFEALVRWQHPERGLVSPMDFIPVAEETGQILQLGEWTLLEASRQMNRWHRRFTSEFPFFISVNLSSKQFAQPNLIEQVDNILKRTSLNPRSLKLEITESAVMDNIDKTTEMLKQLRQLGVQLSIDDFGTGYSSLSYLHRFPIDTLKIDRSFVTRMVDNSENTEIVRTIVMLAQTLGMDVVAEGVETKEQLALLRQLGCEYGQGYYFSKPVTAAEAERIISDIYERPREEGTPELVINDRVKSMRLVPTAQP